MIKRTRSAKAYKYQILLYKYYFDKGFAITNYIKYIIAFVGLASHDVKTTLIFAGVYAVACFIIGYFWTKAKMADIENDVANAFNPFVRQMTRKLKVSSNNKRFK